MANIKLSGRYAKSLIDLATEKNCISEIFNDAVNYNEVAKNGDFNFMVKSPIIKGDKKIEIFNDLFAKSMNPLTLAFCKIVINKGREAYLDEIMDQVRAQINIIREVTSVKFTSATPITEDMVQSVKTIIKQKSNLKNIELTTQVNPDLVGGFIIEYEDKLFDASIAHDLKALKKQFLDNLYIKKF